MSDFDSAAFKKLQKEWAKKLADSGFRDIEKPDGTLTDHSQHQTLLATDPAVITATIQYFDQAQDYLRSGKFRNRQEKEVWRLHSEGLSQREIGRALGLHHGSVNRRIQYHKRRAGLRK